MMYSLQISESQNGKIIRFETIATYYEFIDVYKHYISCILQDNSDLYVYRILEGANKIIEDSTELKEHPEPGRCIK